MAKKKLKHDKKLNQDQTQQPHDNPFGGGVGQVSKAILTALIVEIVGVTLDRLLHKFSLSSSNSQADDENERDRNPLTQILSTLQPALQTAQNSVQHSLADTGATVKSIAHDHDLSTAVSQAVDLGQHQVATAIAEPGAAAKSTGAIVVDGLVDTAKTVVNSLQPKNANKSKQKKKKHKK